MLIRTANDIKSSDITPREVYLNRRALMVGGLGLAAAGAIGAGAFGTGPFGAGAASAKTLSYTPNVVPAPGPLTSYEDATSYNNFYEFGFGKDDPKAHAGGLTTSPWSVTIDGEVDKPGVYALEDLIPATLEERIYRLRCVEGWSMIIPWVGFSLSHILEKVQPTGKARYLAMETLVRPEEMRGQRGVFQSIKWPYVEGLRLDEAMHPLTILATGMYGEELPNQNGAPLRLVVPWKYGFKSIKSIVRITLTEAEPVNTWQQLLPNEYGFYANVNPNVDHPRWSQATERVIGSGLFAEKQETLMFNGYEDQVGGLYAGMDLRKNF